MPLGTTTTSSIYWEFDMRRPWAGVVFRVSRRDGQTWGTRR